jgi:Protein of unknown function (DUF1569)
VVSQLDTRNVADYRQLRFHSIDDCLAEVGRIRAASERGTLRSSGNWKPGQVLAHVAAWIEYGYDGYPLKPPPFFIRWILRLRLRKMLNGSMPRGARIPGLREGTVGMDDMPPPKAAERLVTALKRLQSGEVAKFDSPAFGTMSHGDRILLNLRHAELHLGYLAY